MEETSAVQAPVLPLNPTHSAPMSNQVKVWDRCLHLSSPGGFGKTFAFQVIAAKIRSEGCIVLNVATTGLAAQNLIGGRTAHSRFKIPIPIQEHLTCSIKAQSDLAKLIRETKLIVWDKVFSCHRYNVEAADRTLQDITQTAKLFGGKVVCVSGDPRQTPTIVKRGGRATIVNACIQMSLLFSKFKQIYLTENVRTDADEVDFFLLFDQSWGREGRNL